MSSRDTLRMTRPILIVKIHQNMIGMAPWNFSPHEGWNTKARKNLSQLWLPAIRIIQIVLSIAVTVFILLQARGAGLGSVFGGSSAGTVFKTRRGVEKLIFNLTIVFVVLFAIVSLLSSLIQWESRWLAVLIAQLSCTGSCESANLKSYHLTLKK